jgi:hypothetical protein
VRKKNAGRENPGKRMPEEKTRKRKSGRENSVPRILMDLKSREFEAPLPPYL